MRDLFEHARRHLSRFAAELAERGLPVDPDLELRRGRELLCYYDLNAGHVFLTLPDADERGGKLHALVLRSLMACESDGELRRFVHLLLPITMAHELGHHLRHRLGLFCEDRWHEEEVADRLAAALALRDEVLSPVARRELLVYVERQVAVVGARFDDGYQPSYTSDPAHYMYASLCAIRDALRAPRPDLDEVLFCHYHDADSPAAETFQPMIEKGE